MDSKNEQNLILDFLKEFPEQFSSRKKKKRPDPTSPDGREAIRQIISDAQSKKVLPLSPTTVPDEAVSVILRDYYNLPQSSLDRVKKEHQLSMSAENFVGELLEDYISSTSRRINASWVRAYGDVIRSVDFLKKSQNSWELLQIKNRSNSENSSSQSVRAGTNIQKWFRTFAKSGKTNWDAFPDKQFKGVLNEEGFMLHITEYLRENK